MPCSCAVFGCSSVHTKGQAIHFHTFPRDGQLKTKWINFCRRRYWFNPVNAYICSRHFEPTAYERNLKCELLGQPIPANQIKFKPGVVPTLNGPGPSLKGYLSTTPCISGTSSNSLPEGDVMAHSNAPSEERGCLSTTCSTGTSRNSLPEGDVLTHTNTSSEETGHHCKLRWSNIRDNYRKSLKKKTKYGKPVREYKYADSLRFLKPQYQEKILPPNPVKEEQVECIEPDFEYIDVIPDLVHDNGNYAESRPSHKRLLSTDSPEEANKTSQQNEPIQFDNACIIKEEETIMEDDQPRSEVHAVDAFLSAISPTLKSFTPYYLNLAKTKIFSIVQEYEMEMILRKQIPSSSAPSPVSRSSSTPPQPIHNFNYTNSVDYKTVDDVDPLAK